MMLLCPFCHIPLVKVRKGLKPKASFKLSFLLPTLFLALDPAKQNAHINVQNADSNL